MIGWAAAVVVRSARWAHSHKTAGAMMGMVAMLVIGSSYIAVDVVGVRPLHTTYTVHVRLDSSGGLLPHSNVTVRGVEVGSVRAIRVDASGILAEIDIDSATRIPVGTPVTVGRLSAAGEQYLDFRPATGEAPYLADGATVPADQVSTPVTIDSFLDNTGALVAGMNPGRLTAIVDELDRALRGGPEVLRRVISGLSQATAGLAGLLPQTTELIRNLSVIADTTAHAQPDLTTLVRGSSALFDQMNAADHEVRELLEQGPGRLATLDGVLTETGDPLTSLITNFVAITRAARLRTPAMTALFPALRTAVIALGISAHDNAFHTMADIWPRPTCEYETIPVSPVEISDGRGRLYNYCVTDHPELQIRGSANAPRPAGPDNGAGPPPGVTGDELSVPLPAN
ncbi:MCE family protein [Nocardia rosealba]|uniref:MCE family protein n=1 Tax=Nocardia rosealba TaxID=2878563 RepID=UPI001CD9F22A|nr:MCE family protein [Nocardia rosealba]MCA2207027.1 MCE family protein [Nocardia rosealba]